MTQPLFSIITITYNAAKELPATLRSVDSQRFDDYEHLIIDGASTDGTIALANKPGNLRRHTYSEPDKGLYDAMNKGLRHARGKYLIFLNAGDAFASEDTLSAYAKGAENDPDIIYSDTLLVNEQRQVIGKRHLNAPNRLTFKSFAKGMLVCHQAFAMRREKAPEYDLNYRYSADYEWCLRCLKTTNADKCYNLHQVGIHYLAGGLTDKNHRASLRERFNIMCKYYGKFPTVMRHLGFILRALLRRVSR